MKEKSVRIAVQIHPGAKRNEIVRFEEGIWHLKIAAPPTEGKANKELIALQGLTQDDLLHYHFG